LMFSLPKKKWVIGTFPVSKFTLFDLDKRIYLGPVPIFPPKNMLPLFL